MLKMSTRSEYFLKQLCSLEEDFASAKQIGDVSFVQDIMNEAADLLGQDRAFDAKYEKRVQDLILNTENYIADMDYERD